MRDYAKGNLGTCRISRGSVFSRAVISEESISMIGIWSDVAIGKAVGSAACTQQPHVTQVGEHVPCSVPCCSYPVHGSPTITAGSPDALIISKETVMAQETPRTIEV